MSKSKFMYALKETDLATVNGSASAPGSSLHSAFCLNGNNNNKQGITFNPCSCMSTLGLPPQTVSATSFAPTLDKLNDSAIHKVIFAIL